MNQPPTNPQIHKSVQGLGWFEIRLQHGTAELLDRGKRASVGPLLYQVGSFPQYRANGDLDR